MIRFSADATGATMSIVQYFQEKYNIMLHYGFLPALQAGTDAKPVYLPPEVFFSVLTFHSFSVVLLVVPSADNYFYKQKICRIVEGQRYSKKLNEKQVTALLRATCQRPRERERSIQTV